MGERVGSGYPSDVTDEEWSFVAPYLALCREDAAQRDYALRDVFNGLRYIAKTGSQWRFMPNDLPPWEVVYQQMRRWIDARCFEIMVEDLRILLREFAGRKGQRRANPRHFCSGRNIVLSGVGARPIDAKPVQASPGRICASYSIFTSSVDRNHAVECRFPQEIGTPDRCRDVSR